MLNSSSSPTLPFKIPLGFVKDCILQLQILSQNVLLPSERPLKERWQAEVMWVGNTLGMVYSVPDYGWHYLSGSHILEVEGSLPAAKIWHFNYQSRKNAKTTNNIFLLLLVNRILTIASVKICIETVI